MIIILPWYSYSTFISHIWKCRNSDVLCVFQVQHASWRQSEVPRGGNQASVPRHGPDPQLRHQPLVLVQMQPQIHHGFPRVGARLHLPSVQSTLDPFTWMRFQLNSRFTCLMKVCLKTFVISLQGIKENPGFTWFRVGWRCFKQCYVSIIHVLL